MAKLGWAEEVFYRRLMSVVDDFGRYYADTGLLRAACYPRQLNKVSDPDIGKWLRICVDAALVRVYPASDGESYLQLLDFRQQARAAKSKYPEPPSECIATATQPLSTSEAPAPVFGDVSVDVSVQAPSGLVDREAANPVSYRVPDCPYEAIVASFNTVLPMLPRLTVLNDSRREHVRARWRDVCAAEKFNVQDGVEWFGWFFGHVGRSDFLTGKAASRPGKRPFRANFDWLMLPTNFAKVVDGNYTDKAAA